jgi:pimeloyl-ACP methyl ester carboxylesterase
VRAATLLLVGGQSEYRERLENGATGDEVRRFRECFAQLDWQAFPQLGHMMHHEDAATVATVIASWLQRHESPATMPAS